MWSLKKFRSTKVVSAGKITRMPSSDGLVYVESNAGEQGYMVKDDWHSRFKGSKNDLGYLVVYEDGYESWSPTKAFDLGNMLLQDTSKWVLMMANQMCEQSLDPEQFEMWEKVKAGLEAVRKDLK